MTRTSSAPTGRTVEARSDPDLGTALKTFVNEIEAKTTGRAVKMVKKSSNGSKNSFSNELAQIFWKRFSQDLLQNGPTAKSYSKTYGAGRRKRTTNRRMAQKTWFSDELAQIF